jgi:FAD/FMN-containing dehydrogenase
MSLDLDTLAQSVAGELIRPGDDGYNEARAVWNAMIDRRPAVIVRCTGTADIAAAIGFALANNLELAVRGGGHNVSGNAVSEGGLVVDLSQMTGVFVDPVVKRARVQGGATLGQFDRETQQFGLGTTSGAISVTGIAGLTLGGGLGWLMRKHGLSCDNLVSAQVVTAEGNIVTASETENPELLWALRGGGGNFGVVTSFEFQLHELGPIVYGGIAAFPAARGAEVLAAYRDLVASANPEIGLNCLFLTAPPLPFIPPEVQSTPIVAVGVCWAGDLTEGERLVEPIRELGPVLDLLGPIPYTALQQMFDAGFGSGHRSYWKSGYLATLTDAAMAELVAGAATTPSPLTIVECQALAGAIPVGAAGSAFGSRDAKYLYNIVSVWDDPAADGEQIAWTRGLFEKMEQHATGGTYVNYLGADETDDRVRAAFGEERYERLAAVKATFDPGNVFRLNQNIPPSG